MAWPPGPINAEIARRCLARGFRAGFWLLLGACSGDALWALLVALGVGAVFTGAAMHRLLGVVSVALLLALAAVFLRGAWRDLRAPPARPPPRRASTSTRAGFLLGASMALTSPWNVAFWLAAVGRPEMTRYGMAALLVVAAIGDRRRPDLGRAVVRQRRPAAPPRGRRRLEHCDQGVDRRADALFRDQFGLDACHELVINW